MSSRHPCSDRPAPSRREGGFTVLECEVAILVMVLLAYGVMNLLSSHEVLVADMQGLAEDDGVWYVSQPDDQLARWLGRPATADAASVLQSFGSGGVGDPSDEYELDIVDVTYGLEPLSASAHVVLEDNQP